MFIQILDQWLKPDPDPSFMRMQTQGLKNSKLKEIYKKHDQTLFRPSLGTSRFEEKHGLINYIETKVTCRSLKELTCKGTLQHVFVRVYRIEIQSLILVFSN